MFLNLIVLPGLLSEIYSRRKKEEGRRKKEEGRKPFDEAERVTRSAREGVIDRMGLGH
ncbi:hypothetical protein [Microcoleus sp. herbarium2]|uniref:hypothetical protein n=1 Tax=Microcoleus sp. herbarium2 TaxID=3055433 RepID=UPI002FD6353B